MREPPKTSDMVMASRIDISRFIQWGFYMHVKCGVRTDEGTLTV